MESNNNNDFGKIIRNVGLFIGIPLVFFLILWLFLDPRTSSSNVKYSDYVAYFENNQVESYTLDLGNGNLELTLREAFRTKDINKDGKIDERDYVLKYTVPDVSCSSTTWATWSMNTIGIPPIRIPKSPTITSRSASCPGLSISFRLCSSW